MKMKLTLIAMALLLNSAGTFADYLTKTSGEVIYIPEGYNACEFHGQYNQKGYDPETGKFPLQPIIEAIKGQLEHCAIATDFPTKEDCTGLVISPNIRDERCSFYDE